MTVTETPVIASALLTNEVGLHARPAVKLTQLAKSFAATVELALEPDGPWVDAKSPVKDHAGEGAQGNASALSRIGQRRRRGGRRARRSRRARFRRDCGEGPTMPEARHRGRPAAPGFAAGRVIALGTAVVARRAGGDPARGGGRAARRNGEGGGRARGTGSGRPPTTRPAFSASR